LRQTPEQDLSPTPLDEALGESAPDAGLFGAALLVDDALIVIELGIDVSEIQILGSTLGIGLVSNQATHGVGVDVDLFLDAPSRRACADGTRVTAW
jgi:hypothetical protein